MVSGRLGTLRGSGTLTVLIPGLTANEQAAQVCTFDQKREECEGANAALKATPARLAYRFHFAQVDGKGVIRQE